MTPATLPAAAPPADPATVRPVPPYPDQAYAWYVVVVLLLAYIIAFIDREIINLLVPDIKASLGINDTQMSLLMGGAFAIFYTFFGLLIAWFADRGNRRALLFAGIISIAGALIWASTMVSLAWLGGRWIPMERMVTGVVQFGLGALALVAILLLLPRVLARLEARQLQAEEEGP